MCPRVKPRQKVNPGSPIAKLWILLVGVNQYQDRGNLPSLQYSALDCKGLGEALKEATASFANKEVIVHHDFVTQLPNLIEVDRSIRRIILEANAEDTILFYFSGHGILETSTQQVVLCLRDTNAQKLLTTGLPLNDLLQRLSNCAASQQLIWLDACHSGGMTLRGTARIALSDPTSQLVETLRNKAAESKGFYALLSCDRTQQSWEFPELGHGVFTYYLMRGLRGEAADSQGEIEADALYQYVYHQTLRYIDKTNQQIRLINQQKSSRGESKLQSEFPLQTPKRIVEGFGKVILGKRSQHDSDINPRQALIVDGGFKANGTTLALSQILQSEGDFDLRYFPQTNEPWSEVKSAIVACLNLKAKVTAESEITTAFVYLRGEIVTTKAGEAWLVFADRTRISRSWLRTVLRNSRVAQQIIILDCPGKHSLTDWIEDLQLETDRGQCLIAANAPLANSSQFAEAVLATLRNADSQVELPVAAWISQLQIALAETEIKPQVWLSGTQGVIEVLTAKNKASQQPVLDLGICPYMGLEAFKEDSAEYFYGRNSLVQKLLNQINHRLSMAVVGASGSGKSSIVQAGLLASLRGGKQIPSSDRWWLGCFRPGSQPIKALAQTLSKADNQAEQAQLQLQIEGLLYQGVEGFVRWLRTQTEPMVLLVIDQFEELFTLATAKERQDFINLILGGLKFAGDRFKLVFTLRADFVSSCLEIPELAQILQKDSILVPPYLTKADYRRAIIKPAQQVGLKVESGLVEILLQDLDRSAGDLPLLQFALQKLWQRRENGKLTLQAYQQLGGIKGALERQAQAVYDSLDEDSQACARWIFLNLTQLGEGTEDTRRRITKSELVVARYPEELVNKTLRTLTDAKLLVVNLDNGIDIAQSRSTANPPQDDELFLEAMGQDATIEVVHEILIRHWSSLRWWLEENRSRLRSQRQIEQAALLWQQQNKQDDFLLRGIRLAEAEEILIKYTDELSNTAKEYVASCIDARLAEQKEVKQRLRKAQVTAAALGVLGLAATAFGIGAYRQKLMTQLENIDSLNAVAEAQLLSNQQLESLTTSVKAGEQFKQINGVGKVLVGKDNWQESKYKTTATLQQSIYGTQELQRFDHHEQKVNAVDVSSDGALVIAVGNDNKYTELRDSFKLENRNINASSPIHEDIITNVAFAPLANNCLPYKTPANCEPGKTYIFATSGADKTVRVHQTIASGSKYYNNINNQIGIKVLTGHEDWVTDVAFSRDGKIIASSSRDGMIKLWQQDGTLITTLKGHDGWVNTVSFDKLNGSQKDKYILASGGEDGAIKLWSVDINGGTEIKSIQAHRDRINDLDLISKPCPDNGDRKQCQNIENIIDRLSVISASDDGEVKIWQLLDGSLAQTYTHPEPVASITYLNNSKTQNNPNILAAGSKDGKIYVWDEVGFLQQTLVGHPGGTLGVKFIPDRHKLKDSYELVSTGADKTIRIWQVFKRYGEQTESIYSVATSPTSANIYAAADLDGKINIWRANSAGGQEKIGSLAGHNDTISQIKYSPDGKSIASASWDQTIKLWNVETGKLIDTLTGYKNGINSITFSPDGRSLVSGSEDKIIKIWNITDKPKLIKTLTGHTDSIKAIAVSPDSQLIASVGYDNSIKLWTITGELLQTIDVKKTVSAHKSAVTSLAFTPTPINLPYRDGNQYTLASASWDNTVKLWSIKDAGKSSKILYTLKGHQDGVTTISLNADGTVLASGSGDRNIKLWDTKTGELIKNLRGHTSQINSLAFSSDDKSIISAEEQQGLFWWNLDLDNLLDRGCDRLPDYLTNNPNVKESDKKLCQ